MARARNIKPAFFLNEHLAALSAHARLLFIGLWCLADCEGRLEDRPTRIKAALFPYEAINADALLDELASSPERFILRYEVDGEPLIQIRNFAKHQNPHKNERQAGSRFPEYREKDGTSTVQRRNLHPTPPADSLLLIPDSLTPETGTDASASRACDPGLEKMVSEALAYLLSTDHPNLCSSPGWVQPYLRHMIPVLQKDRPDLSLDDFGACWRDGVDSATARNIFAPNWLKKAFEGKARAFTPATQKKSTHGPPDRHPAKEMLQAFTLIRHILTGEIFQATELEARPEAPGTLYHLGNSYPVAQLEGISESQEAAS